MSGDRLSLYREAMNLESERTKIQSDLARLSSRLTAIHDQLSSGADPIRLSSGVGGPVFIGTSTKSKARARRGELKAQILQALEDAGKEGLRVQPLAESLGVKPVNIYAWFQNAAKKIPQIKKIGRGLYRLEGSVAEKSPVAKSPQVRKGKRSGKHGAIKTQVEELLKIAGAEGMTVRDLAAKMGVKRTNLSVWFSTTGKKNKAIKKIAPGHYRLK